MMSLEYHVGKDIVACSVICVFGDKIFSILVDQSVDADQKSNPSVSRTFRLAVCTP